MVKFPQQRG